MADMTHRQGSRKDDQVGVGNLRIGGFFGNGGLPDDSGGKTAV